MTKRTILIAALLAIACWSNAHVLANPSHQVIDAAFSVHGSQYSPEIHAKAVESYEEAKRKLFDFLEKEAKGDLRKIQAEDLGTTRVLVTRLRRAADQLQILGEPAGADFERRADAMESHLSRLIELSKSVPATQKYIEVFRQFISRSAEGRAKVILELEKLAQKENWEAAETQLFRAFDRLELGTIFLTSQENQAIYGPFSHVDQAIRNAMNEIRATKAKQILQIAQKEAMPHFSSIVTAMNMALKELETKETATWKGEELTSSQLVARFEQAWREAQAGAIRVRGKAWAMRQRRHMTPPEQSANAAEDEKLEQEFNAFSTQVMNCFSRLIDLETARSGSEDVTAKYVELLRALAPVARETNSPEFANSLNQSLAKLRAKTPALDEQVKAYDAATDDLLRWRARVAAVQAARQMPEFQAIENRLVAGTMSHEDYTGLYSEATGAARLPQLMSPAPDVMKMAVKRLIGQKATIRDIVRMPSQSKSAIARYSFRTVAAIPVPLPLEKEIQFLRQELFATSDETPPLTLKAMQAITTAERNDMVAVGGEISGMYLEAVITRFASMPDNVVIMTVLGKLPAERIETAGLSDVFMRFTLTPRWAQHDYFFAQLAPPVEATASLRK